MIFFKNELLYYDESGKENDNITITVYIYIIPDIIHQFILNIILSLGTFETEVYLTIHITLHNAIRYAKFIGTHDAEESLKQY